MTNVDPPVGRTAASPVKMNNLHIKEFWPDIRKNVFRIKDTSLPRP